MPPREASIVDRAAARSFRTPEERQVARASMQRFGRKTRLALDAIAHQGVSPARAAAIAGMRLDAFYDVLRSTAGRAYLAEITRDLHESRKAGALGTLTDIRANPTVDPAARTAASKALLAAGEDGAPAKRDAPSVQVNVGVAVGAGEVIRPGIVIDCSRADPRRHLIAQQAQAQKDQALTHARDHEVDHDG